MAIELSLQVAERIDLFLDCLIRLSTDSRSSSITGCKI
jgi:hypothetical protein